MLSALTLLTTEITFGLSDTEMVPKLGDSVDAGLAASLLAEDPIVKMSKAFTAPSSSTPPCCTIIGIAAVVSIRGDLAGFAGDTVYEPLLVVSRELSVAVCGVNPVLGPLMTSAFSHERACLFVFPSLPTIVIVVSAVGLCR